MKRVPLVSCLFLSLFFFSCNQELDNNQLSVKTEFSLKENIERYDQKNDTYNHIIKIASPDTELGCIPLDCNGDEAYYSHAFFDFEFDLSSCISIEPLSDCMVQGWKGGTFGVTSYVCQNGGVIDITILDLDSFDILPECLPENYSIDLDCVADQLIFQFTPNILDFYVNIYQLDFSQAIFTDYQKQLCAKYCTVWQPFPHVRIVPCEESSSCCKTEIMWNRNSEGEWVPGSSTSRVFGECSGPEPKCKSNFDGPFSTLPERKQCESRLCFQSDF